MPVRIQRLPRVSIKEVYMDFRETEEQVMLRKTVRKFARKEVKPLSIDFFIGLTVWEAITINIRNKSQ